MFWKLMHPKCGGVSFYLTERPVIGQPLYYHTMLYPDGTRPEGRGVAMCGTCGEYAECMDYNLQEVIDDDEIEMIESLISILDDQ